MRNCPKCGQRERRTRKLITFAICPTPGEAEGRAAAERNNFGPNAKIALVERRVRAFGFSRIVHAVLTWRDEPHQCL